MYHQCTGKSKYGLIKTKGTIVIIASTENLNEITLHHKKLKDGMD